MPEAHGADQVEKPKRMSEPELSDEDWYDPMQMRVFEGRRIGWVYIIRAGEDGPIKIGWSRTPARRLIDLQGAHSETLWIMGLIPGSMEYEKELHKRFAKMRLRGEWFRADRTLPHLLQLLMDEGLINVACRESRNIPEQNDDPQFYCCLVRA